MIEGHLMPDHVHVLLAIPPKHSVASVMGYLKGKSSLMIFDRHANLKCRFGNRRFWAEGRCVSTVGLNEATVAKCIRGRESHDIALDKLSVKEYEDPFKRRRACRFDRRATGQDALGLDEARARAFRREPGARGLYPKSKPPFLRVVMICVSRTRTALAARCGGADPGRRRLRWYAPPAYSAAESVGGRCPAAAPGSGRLSK